MRDDQVMAYINALQRHIQGLEQSIRLAFTGQEIRGASLQALLIKKAHITEAEMTEQIGLTIQKMQADAEEAAKKASIITPTTEQVQQVTAETAKAETPVVPVPEAPVTPPQA